MSEPILFKDIVVKVDAASQALTDKRQINAQLLSRLHAAIDRLHCEAATLKVKHDFEVQECKDRAHRLGELEVELVVSQTRFDTLTHELREARAQHQAMVDQIHEARSEIKALNHETTQQDIEIKRLDAVCAEATLNLSRERCKLSNLTHELERLKLSQLVAETECTHQRDLITQTQDEIAQHKLWIRDVESTSKELKTIDAQLEAWRVELSRGIDQMRSGQAEIREALGDLRAEKAELHDLKLVDHKCHQMAEAITKLMESIETLNSESQELVCKLEAHQADHRHLTFELEGINERLEHQRQVATRQRTAFINLYHSVSKLHTQTDEVNASVQDLMERVAKSEADVEALQHEQLKLEKRERKLHQQKATLMAQLNRLVQNQLTELHLRHESICTVTTLISELGQIFTHIQSLEHQAQVQLGELQKKSH